MFDQRLPKFILALFLVILFAAPSFGQPAEQGAAAGKIIEVKIAAPSLKGNLLGDPAEQNVSLYLPPSYETSPAKRYPVVYLLHGYAGTNKTWTTSGIEYGYNIQPIMDVLIASGKIREMIIVAPNGRNAYKGSLYVNSAVTGNWEDYIFRDVVTHIDANYRTLARPQSRGIAGHSMGGYGAVYLGMRHADVFGAVYALSPGLLGFGGLDVADPVWKRVGTLTSRQQLPRATLKSPADFSTNVYVAMSGAFSPNVGRPPLYADFLFEERDGKLVRNEAVYAKWKAKIPLNFLDEYKPNLLSLRGLFLDYGQNEGFANIRTDTSLFSRALAERSIPHVFEIYAGGDHSNKVKERLETRVFQFFSDRLDPYHYSGN